MKKINLVIIAGVLATLVFTACTKQDNTTDKTLLEQITGTYNGTLAFTNTLKSVAGDSTAVTDRKSTRLNSSHIPLSRMPSSA